MRYELPNGQQIDTEQVNGIELYSTKIHHAHKPGQEPEFGPVKGRVTVRRRNHEPPIELEFADLAGAKTWATVFGEQCDKADPANLDPATLKAALVALPACAPKPRKGTLLGDALARFMPSDAEPMLGGRH